MAVLIVDTLETVEGEEDEGQRGLLLAGSIDLFSQTDIQIVGVVELRQVVGNSQLLRPLKEKGVLQGNSRRLDEGEKQIQIPFRESTPRGAIQNLHHAYRRSSGDQRGTENRASAQLRLLVIPALEARIVRDVVHNGGLAGLRHPARYPLPDLQSDVAEVLSLFAQCHLEGELPLALIDEENGPGLRRYELLDVGHDHRHHTPWLQDGVCGGDDLGEHLQTLGRFSKAQRKQRRLPCQAVVSFGIVKYGRQGLYGRYLPQIHGYARRPFPFPG